MTPSISSFIAPVAPAQPVSAPAAPSPHNEFAQMLSQRQAMAHEQAAHDAKAPRHEEAAAPQPQPNAERPLAKPAAPERSGAKAERADKTHAASTRAASASKPAEAAEAPVSDQAAAADKEPVDPALADWLAALNLATPVVAGEPPAAGGKAPLGETDAAQAGSDAPLAGQGSHRVGAGAGRPDEAGSGPAAERAQAAREARGKPDAVAADTPADTAWQAAAEHFSAPLETRAKPEAPAVGAASLAAHLQPAARAQDTAAPTVVNLPTPATAPEFAQSLGLQVSVLMRDGVQQAELHLNPAEMGPISVQIALDGTQAQVNFGADSADTRQIIENGLPELASALRDAGFTLSGGGVHSQTQGRGEGGGSTASNGFGRDGSSSSETEVTPPRINARVSAGGVDLYA